MSEIVIQPGAIDGAGELARRAVGAGKAAVISDEAVMALYGEKLKRSLEGAGFSVCGFAFPAGEHSKNAETYLNILDFLASCGLTRADCVVALGGGVVGDVAGFAAATYLRGVKLVQIPTTILACVDSAVGGKTGIDLKAGKNLAGAFYPANLVLIDPALTDTLPENVYRDGCAEIIKYGAIRDAALFDSLPFARQALPDIIRRCISIKQDIVSRDERDRGERQLLNFGHSFGHAVELASGYTIPHGQAVAIGMALMARACCRKGLCSEDCRDRLIGKIMAFDLPCQTDYSFEALSEALYIDKKRSGSTMTLITLHEIGDCRLTPVSVEEAQDFLREGLTPGS